MRGRKEWKGGIKKGHGEGLGGTDVFTILTVLLFKLYNLNTGSSLHN